MDLGQQETEFGTKHQCELHFELDKATAGFVEATGNQFTVRTQRYNLPEPGHQLNEKSSLHKFLSSWRGKTLTPGDNIELGKLVGVHAHLVLAMKVSQKTGSEYTAITTASPKNKNEVFPPLSGAYTRRVMEAAPVAAPAIQAPAPAAAPTRHTRLMLITTTWRQSISTLKPRRCPTRSCRMTCLGLRRPQPGKTL